MKAIKYTLVGILVLVTALWSLADSLFPAPMTWFALRKPMVQYSGIIAMIAMCVVMVLAARPAWLEKPLDGLDKMYRLHKWLGITALTSAVVHWWFAQGTKWMVGWGWLARPERGNRPPSSPDVVWTLEGWLRTQRHFAEQIGELAFYVVAILLALTLIKRFPYRWFAKTHTWLAALFLVFVWHSFVLLEFAYWTQPIGILTGLCVVAGMVAAIFILLGKTGKRRKVAGTIAALKHDPAAKLLEVTIQLEPGWHGHTAGQFAFITFAAKAHVTSTWERRFFKDKEGAHPFTIASAWNQENREGNRLVFLIKALGDYTNRLSDTLQVGQPVQVEGPYGRFTFEDAGGQTRQIWVGAGIGITPFLAQMQALAEKRGLSGGSFAGTAVDLFHPTAVCSPEMEQELKAAAEAAGIRLHLVISPRDGVLTGERIRSLIPDWKNASLWFCGPAAFGDALRADFAAQGAPTPHFHQELFEMR